MSIYGASGPSRWPTWVQAIKARTPRPAQVLLGVLMFILTYVVLFVAGYALVSGVAILVVLGNWYLAAFGVGVFSLISLRRRFPVRAGPLLAGVGAVLLALATLIFFNWVGWSRWALVALALGCASLLLSAWSRLAGLLRGPRMSAARNR